MYNFDRSLLTGGYSTMMEKFVPSSGTMRGLGSAGKKGSREGLNLKAPRVAKGTLGKASRAITRTPRIRMPRIRFKMF